MSIYRAQTMTLYLMVLSALGTVFTAEAFEWPLALAIFAATAVSLVVPYRVRAAWAKSRFVIVVLMIFLASIVSEVWFGNRDIISGATLFLVMVLISRLYTPRTATDAVQVLTLSFVVVLAGSALNTSFAFAPSFVLVIVCSIWALTTTHLTKMAEGRAEAARNMRISRRFWLSTSALAIVIFLQTTVFFVVFPRMGLGYFKPKLRTTSNATGFSDRIFLGQVGTLQEDSTVVARLEFPEGEPKVDLERLFFRGATLTHFDGKAWSKPPRGQQIVSARADGTFATRPPKKDATLHYLFYQEPTETDYLFLPEVTPVVRLIQDNPVWSGRPRLRLYTDNSGDITMLRPLGMAIQLEGWLTSDEPLTEAPTDDTRALPPLDPRIAELAAQWRGEATTPEEIAHGLGSGLKLGFEYTTEMVASPEGTSPIAHFLLTRKAGHCEYFASAMAVMLRQSGVPARLVSGYRGASFNRFGNYYAVQEYRAHTWVEFWSPKEQGWLRADPTPTARARDGAAIFERIAAFSDNLRYRWNRYVIEYDLDVQVDALRALRKSWRTDEHKPKDQLMSAPWMKVAVVAMVIATSLAAYWLSRRGSPKTRTAASEASKLFAKMEKTLVRRGLKKRQAQETVLQYLDAMVVAEPGLHDPLRGFSDAYLRARFSAQLRPEDLGQMKASIQNVRHLTAAVK